MTNPILKTFSRKEFINTINESLDSFFEKNPGDINSFFIHFEGIHSSKILAHNNLSGFLFTYKQLIKVMFSQLLGDFRLETNSDFPKEDVLLMVREMLTLVSTITQEKCPEISPEEFYNYLLKGKI